MTPTQRKALEQALECLHDNRYYLIDREREYLALYDKAIDDAEAALAEQPESLNWASLNKAADEIVRSKLIWKRFIDGTPLANDIACWMANFALEHTAPQPAKLAEQEPVAWPKADDSAKELGWSWDYKWLESLADATRAAGWDTSMEAIDFVLSRVAAPKPRPLNGLCSGSGTTTRTTPISPAYVMPCVKPPTASPRSKT